MSGFIMAVLLSMVTEKGLACVSVVCWGITAAPNWAVDISDSAVDLIGPHGQGRRCSHTPVGEQSVPCFVEHVVVRSEPGPVFPGSSVISSSPAPLCQSLLGLQRDCSCDSPSRHFAVWVSAPSQRCRYLGRRQHFSSPSGSRIAVVVLSPWVRHSHQCWDGVCLTCSAPDGVSTLAVGESFLARSGSA